MSTTGQLILIHFCTGFLVWFCVATIRGHMADKTYDARMSTPFRRLLMRGRLADRAVWIRQQRLLAWFGLVLGLFVYVAVMIKILS